MGARESVIILSGGLDSTVGLYAERARAQRVLAVSFDYGQRHRKELEFAAATCARLGVEHVVVNLSVLTALMSRSALTSDVEVPDGHYAEASMTSTVVPNRNMIMLSIAAAVALTNKCGHVVYGAHAGDHDIYPDCRPQFVEALALALTRCDYSPLELEAPFVEMTKADIVSLGAQLDVPFADTWSCYRGQDAHCGRCGTCVERREAFILAGVVDPTVYAPDAPELSTMLARAPR